MLPDMKKIYVFVLLALFTISHSSLNSTTFQEGKITGTILDPDAGSPIVGAGTLVKGTNQTMVTGSDGKFSLKAKVGDTLVITWSDGTSSEIKLEPQHFTSSMTIARRSQ